MEKKTDLRIERTYLFLHNAFTQLLEKKRFEEFTVNELCDHAMIRRTTFYKHFADKYEYFGFYLKEVCTGFQPQVPAEVGSVNDYFLQMCRELLRFIGKREKLIRNVCNSTLFPVLLDSLSELIMKYMMAMLQKMEQPIPMTRSQMEGIAAFYSGGLLNTLRLFLKRGGPIEEEAFLGTISGFLNQRVC